MNENSEVTFFYLLLSKALQSLVTPMAAFFQPSFSLKALRRTCLYPSVGAVANSPVVRYISTVAAQATFIDSALP